MVTFDDIQRVGFSDPSSMQAEVDRLMSLVNRSKYRFNVEEYNQHLADVKFWIRTVELRLNEMSNEGRNDE
jgi:hypothetical protein